MNNQSNVVHIGVARCWKAMAILIKCNLTRKGFSENVIYYAVKHARKLNIKKYSASKSMRLAIGLAEHIHLGQLR